MEAKVFDNLEIAEINGQKVYRCCTCKEVLGVSNENYKCFVVYRELPLSAGQPHHLYLSNMSEDFTIREYLCPKCGALFEVDVAKKGASHVYDIKVNV